MRGICTLSDISMGADACCPATAIGATTSNVLVNGKPPITVGDIWGPHPCGGKHCIHVEIAVQGSSKVFINGKPVVTQVSNLSFGDITNTGSLNVLAG